MVESGSTMSSNHDLFFSAAGAPAIPSGAGLTLTNRVVGDPLFVNATGNDFHLQRQPVLRLTAEAARSATWSRRTMAAYSVLRAVHMT